jgi:indolepyruvate ferredoxin oxidoreductase
VLIACDLLVAAGPEALALYAKDRTDAVGNADFQPTADLVFDRDARFDAPSMERRIKGATHSYDSCPAVELAEQKLGDAIYANTIMLGFAWQKGLVPVSSRALYRAIRLNGVDAKANLQAFEIGRIAAFDPAMRHTEAATPPAALPQTMPLDALIAHRTAELAAYQDQAYADRYARRIAAVRAAEAPLASEALTRAAAINLFKLMAIKDEYEVARLYSDGRFAEALAKSFTGGKAKVLLAPPMLSPKDAQGRPRKMAFGPWMLRWGFPTLARLKGLRGGPLDLFAHSAERRAERALLDDYEAGVDKLIAGLTAARLPLAVKIASIPDQIRGFGHVKDAAMKTARVEAAKLWAQWDAPPSASAVEAAKVGEPETAR